MAFKGFIKENTYSVIDNFLYNKQNKNISFEVICYADNKKEKVIMKHHLSFNFNKEVKEIEEYYTSVKQLEEDKLSFIISPAEDNGYVTKRVQERVESDGSKNKLITYEKGETPEYIYIPSIESYMRYDSDTKRYDYCDGLETIHFWENNLSPSKLKKYDNPLELAYTFAYKYVDILQSLERI